MSLRQYLHDINPSAIPVKSLIHIDKTLASRTQCYKQCHEVRSREIPNTIGEGTYPSCPLLQDLVAQKTESRWMSLHQHLCRWVHLSIAARKWSMEQVRPMALMERHKYTTDQRETVSVLPLRLHRNNQKWYRQPLYTNYISGYIGFNDVVHKLNDCNSMLEDHTIQHLISWSNNNESFVMSPTADFSKVLA